MLDLDLLRERFRDRRSERSRQLKLARKTHLPGHRRAAAAAGRAMRKLKALIKKAFAQQPALARVQIHSTAPGRPHWGGAADVMGQFIAPFMVDRGLPIGSGKRTPARNAAIGGSQTSDHLTTHTTTFARDFPTFAGEAAARSLATALGNSGWQPNSFASFNVAVDGHTFRVQILWGSAIAHGDHVHVGVSLVS